MTMKEGWVVTLLLAQIDSWPPIALANPSTSVSLKLPMDAELVTTGDANEGDLVSEDLV